jgi:plasmid stabilization system protein ParE
MTTHRLTLGVLVACVLGVTVLGVSGAGAATPGGTSPDAVAAAPGGTSPDAVAAAPGGTSPDAVAAAPAGTSPDAVAAAESGTAASHDAAGTPTATSTSGVVAACDAVETDGNVVVATLPGSDAALTDEATLYANTTLEVRLCSSEGAVTPYGDAWSLADDDGVEVLNESDAGVRVRLRPGFEAVSFPDLVTNRQVDRGLVVAEPTALAVEPALGEPDRLYVSSSERAESYREHEASFLAAVNETSATVAALNETTANLTGSDASGLGEPEATLAVIEDLNASVDETTSTSRSFRSFLFDVAVTSPTPTAAVDVLTAVEDRETDARSDAEHALAAYVDAAESRAAALQGTIRTNVLVGLVGGLLLGVIGGGALPYLVAEETIGRKRVNSAAAYNRVALWLPVGIGVLVLASTLVALAVTDGLAIFGVIL